MEAGEAEVGVTGVEASVGGGEGEEEDKRCYKIGSESGKTTKRGQDLATLRLALSEILCHCGMLRPSKSISVALVEKEGRNNTLAIRGVASCCNAVCRTDRERSGWSSAHHASEAVDDTVSDSSDL